MATAKRTFEDLIRTSISRQVENSETLAQAIANRLVAVEYSLPKLLSIFRIMFGPLLGLLAPMKARHQA